jgi:AmmeMemoRadiSam system protein A
MGMLDDIARRHLLRRARLAIGRAVGAEHGERVDAAIDGGAPGSDDMRAGVFVTLRIAGRLRGCIGCPEPELLLPDAVEQCAVSAALSDPRFPSLTAPELRDVDLEISVLGSIEPVGDISEVEIGRHGLIVELGRSRGLLLPQVAVEWRWNAAEFAAET